MTLEELRTEICSLFRAREPLRLRPNLRLEDPTAKKIKAQRGLQCHSCSPQNDVSRADISAQGFQVPAWLGFSVASSAWRRHSAQRRLTFPFLQILGIQPWARPSTFPFPSCHGNQSPGEPSQADGIPISEGPTAWFPLLMPWTVGLPASLALPSSWRATWKGA